MNVEEKTILVGRLENMFRGHGQSFARGSLRSFLISSDINCLAGVAGGSTFKNQKPIYWFSK